MPQDQEAPRAQPEAVPGVINRLRIGRLAALCAGVELPGTIVALVTHDPALAIVGAGLDTLFVSAAVFAAHQHHVNRTPNDFAMHTFVKDKTEVNGPNLSPIRR